MKISTPLENVHQGWQERESYTALSYNLLLFCIIGKVPCIKNNDKQKIVAISKHLCGAATGEVLFGDCLKIVFNNFIGLNYKIRSLTR